MQESANILAQEATQELAALSNIISAKLQTRRSGPNTLKIVVADFWLDNKRMTELGTLLPDAMSQALTASATGFQVIDRCRLRAFLERVQIPQEELRDVEVAQWLGRQVDANAVLIGSYRASKGKVSLLVKVIDAEGGRKLAEATAFLAMTTQMENLLGANKGPVRSAPDRIGEEPDVFIAGQEGVTIPQCVYCPPPLYTEEARRGKYQGRVLLSVVITPDGAASRIVVIKGAPYGMTQQAIDAVKSWKFKPAQRDGRPVAVRVSIEMMFRLF